MILNPQTPSVMSVALLAASPFLWAAHIASANAALEEEMFGGGQSTTTTSQPASKTNNEPPQSAASNASEPRSNDTLTLGGRLELQATVDKLQNDSLADAAVSQSSEAELYLDSRPSDDVRGFVKGTLSLRKPTAANQNRNAPNLNLSEMWIKWNSKTLYTTIGKQKLKWGAASFWNPTDFLAVQTLDPLATFDLRPGANLMKFHVPFEKSGHNVYALVDLENTTTARTPRMAARAEFNYGVGDFSGELTTSVVGGKNQPTRFGLDLSTGLGPVDLVVESAWTRKSEQVFYERFTGEDGRMQFRTRDRSKSTIAQVVAGLRYDLKYSDSDSLNMSVEYFWNEAGYSDVALEAYSFFMGQSQPLYLARQYAAASLFFDQPGSFNDSRVIISALKNITDGSWLSRATLNQKITTRSRLEFSLARAQGAGEFTGGVPAKIVDDVKNATSLPAPATEALDRARNNQRQWTFNMTAGIDL